MSVVGEFADAVDLLVVGGGPGGYTAALRAVELGRQVTLVERGGTAALGGACLHVGCIPSKALIELADATDRARSPRVGGLRVTGAEVSLADFQVWRAGLCTELARGIARRLEGAGIHVLQGEARFNRPDRVAVRTPEDRVTFLEFADAIVAPGSQPVGLSDLPFDGERVLDSTGALALTELPDSVVVVGAGYVGLELAAALAKLGARVTVIEAESRILPAFEQGLTAPVARRLAALDVDLRLGTTVRRLEAGSLVVDGADGEARVPAERVVVAVGRRAATDELGLGAAGLATDAAGRIAVGADLRATPHVAAIGDAVVGPALAHKATAEAGVAAEALCGRPAAFEPAAVPLVAFTDPEVASVGLSEAQARAAGLEPRVATVPLTASGRAAILSAPDGFARLVADAATDRVVGVHVVGPHAGELAAAGTLAVELMAAPGDVAGTIHPHPTIGESLAEAAARLAAQAPAAVTA
ncbi:MAG TPA: FAD-dependent oxidoreductase [Solirubrobacteraceae bacterium]